MGNWILKVKGEESGKRKERIKKKKVIRKKA
jgi:hypothetical protein